MSSNQKCKCLSYITNTLLFSNVGICGREKRGKGPRGLRSGRTWAVETLSGMELGRRLAQNLDCTYHHQLIDHSELPAQPPGPPGTTY
jgi:hypothetical protein